MRLSKRVAAALVGLSALTLPAGANAVTVVTKVHGPMKILPHHNHKYCRTHWVHHHRVKKCWYH